MAKKVQVLSSVEGDRLIIDFRGEITLYTLVNIEKIVKKMQGNRYKSIVLNLDKVSYLDTAGAIFLLQLEQESLQNKQNFILNASQQVFLDTLNLVRKKSLTDRKIITTKRLSFLESIGKIFTNYYEGFIHFITFFGQLFATKFYFLIHLRTLRYKEIMFEINESAIKALGIVSLTSFLIGLVVAYQSAYQLKLYGANIFIVDMLGISIFRELAPLITAIVIAGRSGSSYTAQIGAMKITQEIDAMQTMGFEPFAFLVLPRIIALMIMMPILIFMADMMAIFGGMIVANLDLHITPALFIDRFNEVVAIKHFFIGIVKGPFFAFLIATIGIYRGLMVKDDTQSIGFNTTKSVVESIFAVIVCDAIFSIAFTNLGI